LFDMMVVLVAAVTVVVMRPIALRFHRDVLR
jgi:hypothetical protein